MPAPAPPERASSGRVRGALAGGLLLVVALATSACSRDAAEPAWLHQPTLSFERDALARFLERAARLEGSPLARHARGLLEASRGCRELWARDASSAPAERIELERLACLDETEDSQAAPHELAEIRERRAQADGLLLWPLGRDGRLELRVDVDAEGGLSLEGLARPPSEAGLLSLFVPDAQPPARPAIRPEASLAHLRARPAGGLSLSALMPEGGQGDRLFALKGRLLEGALLAGSWELAFLPPGTPDPMPLAVIALHHRSQTGVEAALDQALDRLEATWPIERTPRRFAAASSRPIEGGCFLDLPLLPAFAPCWAVTPESLLIGYRAEALEAALGPAPVASAPPHGGASEHGDSGDRETAEAGVLLDVDLAGFERMDEARPGLAGELRVGDLFERLSLRLVADEPGRVVIRGRLEAGS